MQKIIEDEVSQQRSCCRKSEKAGSCDKSIVTGIVLVAKPRGAQICQGPGGKSAIVSATERLLRKITSTCGARAVDPAATRSGIQRPFGRRIKLENRPADA